MSRELLLRILKKQYQADLKKAGSEEEITQLTKKKRGKPPALDKLDEKIQQYIRALGKAGTPVNARVVLAALQKRLSQQQIALCWFRMVDTSNFSLPRPTHSSERWAM